MLQLQQANMDLQSRLMALEDTDEPMWPKNEDLPFPDVIPVQGSLVSVPSPRTAKYLWVDVSAKTATWNDARPFPFPPNIEIIDPDAMVCNIPRLG